MRRDVAALAERCFDLLVIGGGITGAGVALDAATRGLRVAVIDKGDFASGTSSASSKLVHGGLRYLEHGDFRLVHEALVERGRLLRNAPHLVRPLRFVIPFHRGARVAGWKWRAGLTLYDLLAGTANIRRSRPLSARAVAAQFPGLRTDGLHGGAEYFDAWMDDARLVVAVLRTAAAHGVCVANYVEAAEMGPLRGGVAEVRVTDRLGGGGLRVIARRVVNATGPWCGAVARRLGGSMTGPPLRPTKGAHLLLPGRGLPAALVLLHPADGRVFFVIPWLGQTLLGTTDTDCPEGPDRLTVSAADVAYLLEGHNHFFAPPLTPGDVRGHFVGLRPLVGERPDAPSARSREFQVWEGPPGLWSVAGGKYTTFRSMAETIVDTVFADMNVRRRCRTRDLRLDGAPPGEWRAFRDGEARRLTGTPGLDEPAARHLVERYGTRAAAVAAYLERDAGLRAPLVEGEPDLRAEVPYQRDHEMAMRAEDFFLRRMRLGLWRPELLTAGP
jgi:glycerol-3-phosphate dehydrogenase